jgi:predicted 3-demethylubiquinone-9 3-methyltransferase (glyoxalase superfamily)
MHKQHYSVEINATPAVVWDMMLGEASYRLWTSAFCEGSYYRGHWEQGATMRFLSPGNNGMLSEIAECRRNEYVSIRHLGMIFNGVEDTTSEQVRSWAPGYENYTLVVTANGHTQVQVVLDMPEEFFACMEAAWPPALAKLKALCEQGLKPAITPFLWFNDNAEEAVNYYLSVFPDGYLRKVLRYGKTGPGKEGTVMTMAFTLAGTDYTAINGGPHFTFSGAISFVISCNTQQEIDHFWDKLGAGGQYHQCGWLTDKFGITWQIVPRQLVALLDTLDTAQSERVMQAMMQMVKLEIAPLEQAAAAS